jgi:hypothetical protein
MLRPLNIAFLLAASLMVLCGCATRQIRPLRDDRVLLNISYKEEVRLLTRLGFTNRLAYGVYRDSVGTRLFVLVQPGATHAQGQPPKLVVVSAQGAQVQPWRFPANERVTDDGKVAAWQEVSQDGRRRWQVRSGEWLPADCSVEDLSGDWIAVIKSGGAAWVARLDTPNVAAAKLPDSPGQIAIYATGQTVHVFTRRGWRNEEGPMRYLVYDFARSSAPIKNVVMPSWARITLDMDPATGLAVINDNNSFWGRSWLFDVNTGKRKWISTSGWPNLIVKKDVAAKWIELTKP